MGLLFLVVIVTVLVQQFLVTVTLSGYVSGVLHELGYNGILDPVVPHGMGYNGVLDGD